MSVVSLGEALIDFLSLGAAEGPERFEKLPGGAPLNVACGVARLGVASSFVGKLGDDMFGHHLVDVARSCGVDTSGVALTTAAKTGLAFVSLDAHGERSFSFYRDPSADMLLDDSDVARAGVERATFFHFGSISLIVSPAREATLAAVALARATRAVVSFDPNLRPALWPSLDVAKATIRATLPHADVVKVSAEELEFLAGGDPDAVLQRGPSLLVVTEGGAGCTLHRASKAPLRVPGFPVKVVDTTGAGDAFVAGFLASLHLQGVRGAGAGLRGVDDAVLVQAARWGNAAGALCCTGHGAIGPLPTGAAVAALVRGDDVGA